MTGAEIVKLLAEIGPRLRAALVHVDDAADAVVALGDLLVWS